MPLNKEESKREREIHQAGVQECRARERERYTRLVSKYVKFEIEVGVEGTQQGLPDTRTTLVRKGGKSAVLDTIGDLDQTK